MVKKIHVFLLAALLVFGVVQNSQAALFAVSPDRVIPPAPAIQGTGFPLWYQDFSGPATRPDANPNYGIGPLTLGVPTPGGLKLELCPAGNPMCLSDIVGDEFFYWAAETIIPIPAGGQALLVLATEGTTAALPVVFNRTRLRIDAPVAGTYTVTYPFGVKVYNVTTPGTRAINDTVDEGCLAGDPACDFSLALNSVQSPYGPFLFWDTELPQTGAAGEFFIGNPAIPHKVLGSPNGTNFFRIDGPVGSNLGGPGIDFISTDLFIVNGKVLTGTPTVPANTAPVAVAEVAATLMNTPVMIDVLANDTFTDVPINPGSLVITVPVGGTAVPTVVAGRVKVTFTPAPAFTGDGGFTYTVAGFGGMISLPVAVAVTVEDLKIAKADFRPKFLKWRITGTSSDISLNTIGIQSGPPTVSTNLSGAQETPPVVSPGSGTVSVTIADAGINFNLAITGLLNITSTHLHLGTTDAVLFNLGGLNIASATGTLTAADLNPTAGVTFADAINAILGGNTYIQVHTQAVPAGELRGQLGPNRLVASVPVQADGSWMIDGKSVAFPDAARTISVRSSNGVQIIDVPLKVK